jgi:hypothetical protein
MNEPWSGIKVDGNNFSLICLHNATAFPYKIEILISKSYSSPISWYVDMKFVYYLVGLV